MSSSDAEAFPKDLWLSTGLPDRDSRMARARQDLEEIERLYGAPREASLVHAFLDSHLPGGRLLVYGAGTHTPPLMEFLRRRGRMVIGIIDRMAEQIRTFDGYDVFTPREAVGLPYDAILLSHGSYEDEMLETLRALGVPRERVVPIYAHRDFHRLARQAAAERFEHFSKRRFDALILACTPTVVVPDRDLAAIFPPDRTLKVHFGRPDSFDPSGPFETVDLKESLHDLARLLQVTRPKVAYVQSIAYKNYLGYWLKQRFPSVTVIHELYDHTSVWRDHDLERLFGLNKRTITRLRLSEYAGAQVCDLIVSKRGGPDWDRFLQGTQAPYRLFFPMVRETEGGDAADGVRSGMVYAGFLPAPAFLATFKNGYDFLGVMQEVCVRQGITASLFNASHIGPDADRIYAPYLDAYRDGPLRYCRRLPYDALLGELNRFAYGWICDRVHEFQIDRHVGICNRWTGYVSAGLPTIIDAEWRLMADLTRRYGAGLVVDRADPDLIVNAMEGADAGALRRGAGLLRRHLLDHNAGTMADIAAVAALPA